MTVRIEQDKGLAFARYVVALARGGDPDEARRTWPAHPSIAESLRLSLKTAVAGATTGGWGSDLVPDAVAGDFIQAVRAANVVDRLPVRRGPLQVPIPRETSSASFGGWAGHGAAIPLGATTLEQVTLPPYLLGAIGAFSNELIRVTRPEAIAAVRDLMVAAVTLTMDQQFLDPAVSAVANSNPASITSGATQVTSTGPSAAAMLVDFRNMVEAVATNFAAPFWIMGRKDATRIASTLTAGNSIAFPTMPRELLGIPVMITNAAPTAAGSPATDRVITLLDAASIIVAESGGMQVSMTRVSSVQMESAPTGNAGASPSATNVVSAFQTESTLVKVVRRISWLRAHDASVAYMAVSY